MPKIRCALISVSDKTGISAFAHKLSQLGIKIISTGGTAKLLQERGIKVVSVSEVTGFPEIMDGRVKTLHPKIHGGILAIRDNEKHQKEAMEHDMEFIDLVVVNLYPFERTISRQNVDMKEAIENIDIGGPAMLRAAAKNYKYVAAVVNPDRYNDIIKELEQNDCEISEKTCEQLAMEVFAHTARYDNLVANYLQGKFAHQTGEFPQLFDLIFEKVQDLRYGENPHQKSALYKDPSFSGLGFITSAQLHGKEISFNNVIDIESALKCILEFEEPACVIIKHTNPCGVAVAGNVYSAFLRAKETDPVSAFGGIVGFNRSVDDKTAAEISSMFIEAIIAPEYEPHALSLLKAKKNIRIMKYSPQEKIAASGWDFKRVSGGLLLQSDDILDVDFEKLEFVTNRKPIEEELQAMKFSWKVVKHVKSNAIVFAKKDRTMGIGAGQMSRVDSVQIAIAKAKKSNLALDETVVASDAFFPFRDGVDILALSGATAIIQPGGSLRDEEVIQACNEHNLAMAFTKIRHFKH